VTKVTNVTARPLLQPFMERIVDIKKVFNWCWNDRSVDTKTTVSGIEFQSCLGGNRKSSAADGGKWFGSHTEIFFLLLATYFGNCTKGVSHRPYGAVVYNISDVISRHKFVGDHGVAITALYNSLYIYRFITSVGRIFSNVSKHGLICLCCF